MLNKLVSAVSWIIVMAPKQGNLSLISTKSGSSSALLPGGVIRWNSLACSAGRLRVHRDFYLFMWSFCSCHAFGPRSHIVSESVRRNVALVGGFQAQTIFRASVGTCGSTLVKEHLVSVALIWLTDLKTDFIRGGRSVLKRCWICFRFSYCEVEERMTEWTDNPCLTGAVCGSRNTKNDKKRNVKKINKPDKISTKTPAQLAEKGKIHQNKTHFLFCCF